ncbi:MAG: glycosyltransferase [Bacteroidaceae bacterium]|nr:glycosyltransferase [Bacteroidaceae bacterium]
MKNILFILFKRYNGILEGGGLVNQRNVRIAEEILGKENVCVYYVHDDSKQRSIGNLALSALFFPFGYFNGMLPRKIREIVRMAEGYDYVFISTTIFGIVARKLKEAGYKGRVVAHFHNVESIYYDSLLPKRMPFRNIVINCAAKNDAYCCRYADVVLALNERDSHLLKKMYQRGADYLVPIALRDKCSQIAFNEDELTACRPRLLFLGSSFTANNEGVLWFVQHVLPHVDAEFRVVGRDMDKLQTSNPCLRDVTVFSSVPSLEEHFLWADFMVLPIFSGSGMKVKTCESMMYGRNILGSSETFEGYHVDIDRIGRLCNTAQEYIDAITYYGEHPVKRYNSYARETFLQQYSQEVSQQVFRQVFDSTLL